MITSIYNQKNRLYLDWDIHYKCNFSCEYCFQKFDNLLQKNIPNYKKNIDLFLILLQKHSLPFTLGLLGGEPTLFEDDYFKILNFFKNKIYPKKSTAEIYVSTNLSKPISFYKNHPIYNNIYQWVSIHPEYHLNDVHFFEKLELLLKCSPDQFILSPMLFNITPEVEAFYKKVYQFYLDKKDTHNIIYSPQIIFKKGFEQRDLTPDLSNTLYNNSIKEFFIDSDNITLNEYLFNPPKTTGIKCMYNYYCITPELKCFGSCAGVNLDILKNPLDFLKLKPKELICQKKTCLDYPMILSTKKSD